MKKILIPIDGSERSKISVDLLKKLFEPGDIVADRKSVV